MRHAHALLTVVATLGLICLGGLVTSHGAGMAVPDWPNTYGYNMFFFPISDWVGGIFYEHTHRLWGSVVGLLTLVLAAWLHGHAARPWLRWGGVTLAGAGGLWAALGVDHREWAWVMMASGLVSLLVSGFWPRCAPASRLLRWLGSLALVGVILQGVLGGLRVVLLADAIGIVHAILAQLFLVLLVIVALLTSPWWARRMSNRDFGGARAGAWRWVVLLTAGLILVQLAVGASMRHRHAGLAVPDFPLAHGGWWPATDTESLARYNRERPELRAVNPLAPLDIHLHMIHRYLGVGIVLMLGWTAWQGRRVLGPRHELARGALIWAVLGGVQLLLGAITVWTNKSADLTTAHVAVGSVLLAWGGLLSVLVAVPRRGAVPEPAGWATSGPKAWATAPGSSA